VPEVDGLLDVALPIDGLLLLLLLLGDPYFGFVPVLAPGLVLPLVPLGLVLGDPYLGLLPVDGLLEEGELYLLPVDGFVDGFVELREGELYLGLLLDGFVDDLGELYLGLLLEGRLRLLLLRLPLRPGLANVSSVITHVAAKRPKIARIRNLRCMRDSLHSGRKLFSSNITLL
jgi:hypothetical protein